MSISSTCPRCLSVFDLPDELVGKAVRCKRCEERFIVKGKGRPDDEETERVADRASRRGMAPSAAPARRSAVSRDDEADTSDRPRSRRRREDDDDLPRSRRRERYEDDDDEDLDRPRFRKKQKQGGGTMVVLIVLGILGGVFLLGVVGIAGIWFLTSRSSSGPMANSNSPGPPAPGNPMPPGFPQIPPPPAPPQLGPAGMPGGQRVSIELSNARRERERIGIRTTFSVDYRITQGAAAFNKHYFLVIKPTAGPAGEARFSSHELRGSGTLSVSDIGVRGGVGRCEIYMEEGDFAGGPFGSRNKVSNSVFVN